MYLGYLPPEIYSSILEFIDKDEVQQVVLSLTRAVPYAPIPLENLFREITLNSPERVFQLYRRLRSCKEDAWKVQTLRIETWSVDAQVLLNLLSLLSGLKSLSLWIGPKFSPEELQEILSSPRQSLVHLSLRFRPYLQQANYYQFHKGAYFDSSLNALASWPESSLRTLSVVQDRLLPGDQMSFAQPLVFFTLRPLVNLSTSPVGKNIYALRFRAPEKNVLSFISATPGGFPALHTLDISTSSVLLSAFCQALERLNDLRHVNLDSCKSLTAALRDIEDWATIGKCCALAGQRRAREREKIMKSWREALEKTYHSNSSSSSNTNSINEHRTKGRAGRKGLATATLSLRGASDPTISTQLQQGTIPSSITAAELRNLPKIRIVPSPPSILSLSISAPHINVVHGGPQTDEEHHVLIRETFAQGWKDGIKTLRSSWKRLHRSQVNKVSRVMSMKDYIGEKCNDGLEGLEEMGEDDWKRLHSHSWQVPSLCLEGRPEEGPDTSHAEDCVHKRTNLIWKDNITRI